ncbi:Nn.00g015210.m01.CDS01 [Neocucurbitaria sp. VM-36]
MSGDGEQTLLTYSFLRETTPQPASSNMESSHQPPLLPPSTPGPSRDESGDGSIIMGSQHATIPPSPCGIPPPPFALLTTPSVETSAIQIPRTKSKQHAQTGAGVKKTHSRKEASKTVLKLVDTVSSTKVLQEPFRFMDLPGEIRNMIYHHTYGSPKQALLVHRPRVASLRPRTRLDRARPLASDITGNKHDTVLYTSKKTRHHLRSKSRKLPILRETNRPFFGLTQVCKLIRHEYRPIYLQSQEIGMDLTNIVEYLETFYCDVPRLLAELGAPRERKTDLPFTGNLTIAIGEKVNQKELSPKGVEVFPLLDIWANSFKIEAGFGRYLKVHYVPERDGEAKDLYRLFGRRVLRNRSCSPMNNLWRTILRSRALASVRIHRKPASRPLDAGSLVHNAPSTSPPSVLIGAMHGNARREVKPYIHIIFKNECAEPWMTRFDSEIPKFPNWLLERGFGDMEYFDVKVGIDSAGAE